MKTTEAIAREAGIPPIYYAGTDISSEVTRRGLERFAALVRARALTEALAAVRDERDSLAGDDYNDAVEGCAAAILALAGVPAPESKLPQG